MECPPRPCPGYSSTWRHTPGRHIVLTCIPHDLQPHVAWIPEATYCKPKINAREHTPRRVAPTLMSVSYESKSGYSSTVARHGHCIATVTFMHSLVYSLATTSVRLGAQAGWLGRHLPALVRCVVFQSTRNYTKTTV